MTQEDFFEPKEGLHDDILVVSLPVYMDIHYKTKKDKRILLGMNYYRNAHYIVQNNMKKFIADIVYEKLSQFTSLRWSKFTVDYSLVYANSNCDALNIISFVDKAFIDALRKLEIVTEDTVKEYTGGSWRVIGQSKLFPTLIAVVHHEQTRTD